MRRPCATSRRRAPRCAGMHAGEAEGQDAPGFNPRRQLVLVHMISSGFLFPLQASPVSPSSSGGGGRGGETPFQQEPCGLPKLGVGGRSGPPLSSATAALSRRRGRRGILRAVGRSEPRQHHGLRFGHFLVPLLPVPGQRGPLRKQRLCLPGWRKQVSLPGWSLRRAASIPLLPVNPNTAVCTCTS